MAKKDKNSLLNIHYSRTMTPDNLSKAANYVGEYVLKGLGTFGKIMTAPFVQLGPTSATIYKSKKLLAKEKEIELKSEELLGKAMTWASPLNYGAALATGNGLNASKGEEEVASWSPAWQAVGRLGEFYAGPKIVKGIKATPKAVVNTAAKAGVKPAKAAVVAREINKGIKQNTRNGKIEVTEDYFNSPDKWYRVSERPEKIGIELNGKNVTTSDDPVINGTINGWRESMLSLTGRIIPGKGVNEGYFIFLPRKISLSKHGAAHGNTSQAAKGLIWLGTFAFSDKFPIGVIEGLAPVKIFRGMNNLGKDSRTNFVLLNWEDVPLGARVGFHTGEMPISNLGWFLKTKNGTYTYEPIIPEKRISYQPKLLLDPSTSLAFFERRPSKNNIVGTSLDYSMKDSKGIDFIKQFFALLKINGKEYTLEGLKDAKNVQQGLPEYIQSHLNLNTVERAVRAMRKNRYSEREILLYVDKVNEEMNKVKVGMYSDEEYNAAGALNFGGFYNSDLNFISVNKDAYLSKPNFTPSYILKHEGRHLIDYNTSMTDDVINILEKAYDKDFLEIPKHEDAGNLKDYLHMDRERVTTNRDARDVLLSNLEKHPGEFLNLTKFAQTSFGKNKDMVDFLNELIQYAEPEDIINAVENSNGYGKRYIDYLKKNNKLTSTKIEQLRLAMIQVPSYLLPVAGGYTLYNIFNQPLQQLQYLKQGGKMNILEFLKNGSGIHIKEKNKGKFTSYCGGKVTDECILKGKNSSNPAIRKRATFAANVRKWKHLIGGTLVETLGGGNTITAKLKAKANLTKRKAPDWDNLDRGYRYLTLDMKLPHDLAIAVMGNVVEESQGDYKAALKKGRGRGLIQWDGLPTPTGRYGLWGKVWASVAKKANVYDPDTDTVKNYWAPWNGLKGELVRLKFISAPLKLKARIYAESYLRPGKPRIADRQLSAMQLDSIYNPKIKNIVIQLKEGGKINFLSLGGLFNNVSNFLNSDTGKSVLSIGSGLLGLGKGIHNSGKIADAANEAEEAINALESVDRLKSFAEKYASILLEKLSKPDIDVNGSPIHTNGVNTANEAYNLTINTFNFDNSKYNQMRKLIKELAYQALSENSSSMIGSVGGLIDSIGGIAGSLLNKKSTTSKSSLIGNPDSSKQVITTNSGMSGTVDDWRKAILG